MASIGAVTKQAWTDISAARKRGEKLDSDYVVDVGNLYLLTLSAGVDMGEAITDHRSVPKSTNEKLDAAEKLMAELLASGRMAKAGAEPPKAPPEP